MSSRSVNSYRRDRPSSLRFDNQQHCRICSKPLQILVVGPKSPNFQKFYYACPSHRFQAWCYAINEGEPEHNEADDWKHKYKRLKHDYKIITKECKSLEEATKLLKFGFTVMICIISFLAFLVVRKW